MKNVSYVIYINADIKNRTPLHIGNGGEDILTFEDFDNGKYKVNAYMPATGIAGAFRAYLSSINGEEKADEIFGSSSGKVSKLTLYNAYSAANSMEFRPGVCIEGETGAAKQSSKFSRNFLADGHRFTLKFKIAGRDKQEAEETKDLLYECLKAVNFGVINFGAYKTSGAGLFNLESVKECRYDLKNIDELMKYLKNQYSYIDVTKGIKDKNVSSDYVLFKFKGRLTEPILIKNNDSLDYNEPDGANIKSGKNCIIPGSSLKGIIRARAERVLNYLGKDKLNDLIFGTAEGDEKKIAGRVYTEDVVIKGADKKRAKYHKIKIDKFTGGTINSNLMDEEPVMGDIEFSLKFKKFMCNEENYNNAAIGLLIYVLRDMATENLNVGSGYSIGRGLMQGEHIEIRDGDKHFDIDIANKKITSALNAENAAKEIECYIKALNDLKMNNR